MEIGGGASATPSIGCGGVGSAGTNRRLGIDSRGQAFVFFVFAFSLAALVSAHVSASLQGTDFPDFYCAARMLAEGHGHQLYDAEVQRKYQARYAGRVGTLYIPPPFEAVVYLAVAWLPLRRAYLLWSLLNVAVLIVAARRLTEEVLIPLDSRVFPPASVPLFSPLS